MFDVKNATYVGGYKIRIEFSNGECGVADLEQDLWGPVFEPLRDPEQFKKFKVSDLLHTLVWENGTAFPSARVLVALNRHKEASLVREGAATLVEFQYPPEGSK